MWTPLSTLDMQNNRKLLIYICHLIQILKLQMESKTLLLVTLLCSLYMWRRIHCLLNWQAELSSDIRRTSKWHGRPTRIAQVCPWKLLFVQIQLWALTRLGSMCIITLNFDKAKTIGSTIMVGDVWTIHWVHFQEEGSWIHIENLITNQYSSISCQPPPPSCTVWRITAEVKAKETSAYRCHLIPTHITFQKVL